MAPTDRNANLDPRIQRREFNLVNNTEAKENAVDLVRLRGLKYPTGVIASIAHVIKGALGSGILALHAAYKGTGLFLGLPMHIAIGIYMMWCLFVLIRTTQIISRRTNVGILSYPDVGEAACRISNFERLRRWSKTLRYFIDMCIMIDLFGACCTYQIIVAKTIKQLVEDNTQDKVAATVSGYPNLRIYLLILMLPFIMISMLRYLKFLAPFSLVGNFILMLIIGMTINYAFVNNKGQDLWEGCERANYEFMNLVMFAGTVNFSMSCSGIIVDVTNNMAEPHRYPIVCLIGLSFNVIATCATGFFGYSAFKDESAAPISNNFPMTNFNKAVRFLIGVMVYTTHGLNFYSPFSLAWRYIAPKIKPENLLKYEYLFRFVFSVCITITGIIFPSISAIIGFIGCFCLTNMAYLWPLSIELIVIWERPGLGRFRWKLWRNLFLMIFGILLFTAGSLVSGKNLIKSITSD